MTANKSIDGLSTRAAKEVEKTSRPKATSTSSKKSVKKIEANQKPKLTGDELTEEFVNAPTTDMWDSIKFKDDKPEKTEDFIETKDLEEDEESEELEEPREPKRKTHQKAKKVMDIKTAPNE